MKNVLDRTFSIKQTQANFSRLVWLYDIWGKLTESKAIQEAVSLFSLKNNINIIDVGVGTGELFKKIIPINKDGINIGMDLSVDMIKKADSKLKLEFSNFSLTVGNAFHLPYKAEHFDFVFSSYVLDLLPVEEFENVISEIKRVLKPNGGGILITMSLGRRWYNKIWFYLAAYFPSLLTNCRPVELVDYLTAAGLQIEERIEISQNTFASEIIKFRK